MVCWYLQGAAQDNDDSSELVCWFSILKFPVVAPWLASLDLFTCASGTPPD